MQSSELKIAQNNCSSTIDFKYLYDNKKKEWTSIPSMFVQFFSLALMLIPLLYIWISGWWKKQKVNYLYLKT